MTTTEEILDKRSYDFLKGAKRVRVKVAMEEYARRKIAELLTCENEADYQELIGEYPSIEGWDKKKVLGWIAAARKRGL